MKQMTPAAVERAMKLQDVINRIKLGSGLRFAILKDCDDTAL